MSQPPATQPVLPTMPQVVGEYLVVFVAAFLACLILTPLMRRLALAYGVVDRPNESRKLHTQPVAYLGGIAIFLAWTTGVIASFFISSRLTGDASPAHMTFPLPIVLGAAAITLVGLIDDVFHISPRVKIGGQLLAAAALASQTSDGQMLGARLVAETLKLWPSLFPGQAILLPDWITYTLGTAIIGFLVVAGCNAVNLLDGLDGLAAGVTGICVAGFLFIAAYIATHVYDPTAGLALTDAAADPVRLAMCLAILGAVLGFLPYNFNPASIFMGDAGSLLLGYLCISTILLFAHSALTAPKFVAAALVVFALPAADTTLAIVRRKMAGQPLFSADRQHLHHQLLRTFERLGVGRNLTVKLAVLSMYLLASVFAVLGCLLVYPRMRFVMAVFGVLFAFVIVGAYKAGARQRAAGSQPSQDSAKSP